MDFCSLAYTIFVFNIVDGEQKQESEETSWSSAYDMVVVDETDLKKSEILEQINYIKSDEETEDTDNNIVENLDDRDKEIIDNTHVVEIKFSDNTDSMGIKMLDNAAGRDKTMDNADGIEIKVGGNADVTDIQTIDNADIPTIADADGINIPTIANANVTATQTIDNADGIEIEASDNADVTDIETIHNEDGTDIQTIDNTNGTVTQNADNADGTDIQAINNADGTGNQVIDSTQGMNTKTINNGDGRSIRTNNKLADNLQGVIEASVYDDTVENESRNAMFKGSSDDAVGMNKRTIVTEVAVTKSRAKEGKSKKYFCDRCKKAFSRKRSYANHTCRSQEKAKKKSKPTYRKYGDLFPCTRCDMSYTYKINLRKHSKVHFKKNSYPCVLCEETLTSLDLFSAHWAYSHLSVQPQDMVLIGGKKLLETQKKRTMRTKIDGNCKSSDVSYSDEQNKTKEPQIFRCPGFCKIVYTSETELKEHIKGCKMAKFFKISEKSKVIPQCKFCGRMYSKLSHLKYHLNRTCPVRDLKTDKDASCKFCGVPFPSHEDLVAHIKQLHNATVQCPKCDGVMFDERSLRPHMQKFHPEDPTFSRKGKSRLCHLCGKEYTTVQNFKEHMIRHTKIFPFQCPSCDKGFIKSVRLKRHYSIVHEKSSKEKKYLCPHCGKRFLSKVVLQSHLTVHTGERPFKCEYCDAKFKVMPALVVHKRKHTGETPYKCEKCDKKFKTLSQIRTHAKTHSGVKEHKCLVCGEVFRLPHHLRAHTARKHTYTDAND